MEWAVGKGNDADRTTAQDTVTILVNTTIIHLVTSSPQHHVLLIAAIELTEEMAVEEITRTKPGKTTAAVAVEEGILTVEEGMWLMVNTC